MTISPLETPIYPMETVRETALKAIDRERKYQDEKWGPEFDDKNTANDWIAYIDRYAAKSAEIGLSPGHYQIAMVKVAAIAVAAMEASSRNDGLPPRHYDPC